MPKPKNDYTLRKLRSEHKNAIKRLESWEDTLQITIGDIENEEKKEIPQYLIDSVQHYRNEVSSLRDKILKEEEKLNAKKTRAPRKTVKETKPEVPNK